MQEMQVAQYQVSGRTLLQTDSFIIANRPGKYRCWKVFIFAPDV